MTDMSAMSGDIPRPDRHGHTPEGVSGCPGCPKITTSQIQQFC